MSKNVVFKFNKSVLIINQKHVPQYNLILHPFQDNRIYTEQNHVYVLML